MITLTRIILHNTRSVIHLLKSRERVHALILRGFPYGSEDRALWREEDHEDRTLLYVVSSQAPDYGFLSSEYDSLSDVRSTSYDGFLNSLHNGQKYGFRLTCNPVMNKNIDRSMRGKKIPIVGKNARNWVVKKLEDSGLSDVELGDTHDESKFVFFKNKNHKITIRSQSYDGSVTIKDADSLKKSLVDGLGPSKAYGCGMLILEPIR
jgi:CRISPR system Cascade subunit CasE